MKKKLTKNNISSKSNTNAKYKLVCPQCYKNMKSKKLNDGYIVCAYCGLVVSKQPHSLEPIDAPGFIKVPNQKFLKKIITLILKN